MVNTVGTDALAFLAAVVLAADALAEDLKPLFGLLLETIPAPQHEEAHPMQALVTNLDASPYMGRLALCRIHHGTMRKGEQVAWCRADGTVEQVKLTELYITEELERVSADEAGPGDIVAIAGMTQANVADTFCAPEVTRPINSGCFEQFLGQ
mgnify:CR=1 FL=1